MTFLVLILACEISPTSFLLTIAYFMFLYDSARIPENVC